jgi:tetratricopeptide (TPR) repeat protein
MTEEGPEGQSRVIDSFIERLLECNLDRSVLDEFCERYPSLKEPLERKFSVMSAIDEAFEQESLAGSVIDDFLVCEEIGRGGMGVVYLALQQALDRYVALKVLPIHMATGNESIRRLQKEARIVARFSHPNIVPVFSSGSERGVYYIAMGLVSGLPLSKVIDALKPLPVDRVTAASVRDVLLNHPEVPRACLAKDETGAHDSSAAVRDPSFWHRPYSDFVLSLCSEVADALAYAHRNGVCHGDLKPSNIMLTADGTPMLVDFGLARDIGTLASIQAKDFLGTLAYSSPEQLAGNVRNEASDIWSLGVTIYEMLTLRQPFRTEDVSGTLERIAKTDPPPLRSAGARVSRDVEAIVARCLEKEPRRRFRDAGSLKGDIDSVLAGRPVAARPIGRTGRLVRWAGRNRAISLLIVFLLLLSTIAGFALFGYTIRNLTVEGASFSDEGRYTEALRSNEKALRMLEWVPFSKRRRAEVLSALGAAWWGKGGFGKSISFYEDALRLDPDCVSALIGLGDVYFEMGTYDKTIGLYNRVLLLSPEDRNSYFQRAKAFRGKGMYDDAIADFHSAMRIAPDDRETARGISSLLAAKGLTTESRKRTYLREKGFSERETDLVLGVKDNPSPRPGSGGVTDIGKSRD